jgi:hypothetical protein
MFKKLFAILTILVVVFGVSSSLVSAKNDKNYDIPEQDGTYDVLGHPELKVRVFVHKVKPPQPPAPETTLVCKLDDPKSEAVVDSAGWHLPATFTYNLNKSSVPSSIGGNNLVTIADNSFSVWIAAINKKVNIVKGSDTKISQKAPDGKNIIAWGKISASALGVTYIWYYPSTGIAVDVDTIMNSKYFWKWSGISTCAYTNSYDAQSILTHELGHWFGLDDEYTSEYVNNTMYGYGFQKDAKGDTLTDGDVLGVNAIYKK